MKLAQDISRYRTDRGIACHLSKLMAAHPIGHNVQAKGQIPGIAGHGRGDGKQTILVQFALLPNRLPTTGKELLKIELRVLITDTRLDLLFRKRSGIRHILRDGWRLHVASQPDEK